MYFDPGSGSVIIQILLASLATIGTFFVMFKTKIKSFFHKKKDSGEKDGK